MTLFKGKKFSGFTLVELVITVGITVLLTGVLVIYSQDSRRQILLNVEKGRISQAILEVKSLALAGYTAPPTNPPPCSYGMKIDYENQTYYLFEYYPPSGCSDVMDISSISENSLFYRITKEGIIDKDVKFVEHDDSFKYLVFIPPSIKVIIFKDENTRENFGSLAVYLETKDGTAETKISISQSGELSF